MARLHKRCWLFRDVGWVRAVGALPEVRIMQSDNIASPCLLQHWPDHANVKTCT